jgi:hypothetical protein
VRIRGRRGVHSSGLQSGASLLLWLAVGGCAGGAPLTQGGAPEGEGFVRLVAPFPVLDQAGEPFQHPFLGGLLAPRPQLVDIDGDGDLDLFVQERAGELMFFENTGTATDPSFTWRTDRFQGLQVGEWSRFVDLDGDGALDLLAEEPFSHVRVYRNEGTPTDPRMVLMGDSLRNDQGRPIFADRQNIPGILDLDCDGLLDLFLGRVDGTLAHYEETGRDATGLPRFRLATERFEGIEIIGQVVGGSRHGANSMFFADLDGDGAPELFWGDYFEPGLLRIQNRGSCSNPSLRSTPVPVVSDGEAIATSGFNAPWLADLNGDGELDLLIGVLGGAFNPILTAADNLHYHENLGDGEFTLRSRRFLYGIDTGSESVPALGDLDGDGDLDLLVANKIDPGDPTTGTVQWFENVGSPRAPAFQLRGALELPISFHKAPALGNLWGDPLPAMALGTWNDGIHIYRNRGDTDRPSFELVEELKVELSRGGNGVPALGDVYGDGLLDLVVGRSSGELSLYRNVGTASAPRFEEVTDRWLDLDVGRRAAPALVDLDGNGRLDLLVGSEEGGLRLFRNLGPGPDGAPRFQEDPDFNLPLPPFSTPALGDLTGNGRPDLMSGSVSGGVLYFENRGG